MKWHRIRTLERRQEEQDPASRCIYCRRVKRRPMTIRRRTH